MAGYKEYSKSNAAIEAEAKNRFPASVAAKMLGVSVDAVRKYIKTTEWHHTSSRYNKTPYYNIDVFCQPHKYSAEKVQRTKDLHTKMYNYIPPNSLDGTYEGCTVCFPEWSGSRAHPVATDVVIECVKVIIKGKSATFKHRGATKRKLLSCKGFSIYQGGKVINKAKR